MAEHLPIRSFVLRQGRVSNAQHRAHVELMPRYGISFEKKLRDRQSAFGTSAPTFLESGFGMGETTAAIGRENLGHDYLAVEVHTPGVGSLLKQLDELELTNVRVIQHDVVEVLQ